MAPTGTSVTDPSKRQPPPPSHPVNTPNYVTVPVGTLIDGFDTTLDRVKWLDSTSAPNTYYDSTNHRVGIVCSSSFFTLATSNAQPGYSILNSSISALCTPSAPAGGQEFHMDLQNTGRANVISFLVFGTNLIATTNPGVDLATTTYNSTTHKWLRLRGDATTIYWDYSADGVTWTNFASVAFSTLFSFDAWTVNFSQGGASGQPDAFIDNVNVAPVAIAGESDGTSTVTGALSTAIGLAAATGNGVATDTANLNYAAAMNAATANGVASDTANLNYAAAMSASSAGVGSDSAAEATAIALAASAAGAGSDTSALGKTVGLAGEADGLGGQTRAALGTPITLPGSTAANGAASITAAELGVAKALLSTASHGVATDSAALLNAKSLVSLSAGAGTIAGGFDTHTAFVAATAGAGADSAVLTVLPSMSSTSTGLSTVTAALSVPPALYAAATGSSAVTSNLSTVSPAIQLLVDAFQTGITQGPGGEGWWVDGTQWDSIGGQVDFPASNNPAVGHWLIARGVFSLVGSAIYAKFQLPARQSPINNYRYASFGLWNYVPHDISHVATSTVQSFEIQIFEDPVNAGNGMTLQVRYQLAGNPSGPFTIVTTLTNFDAPSKPYFRIRESAGTVSIDNGADGLTWTQISQVPTASLFDLTHVWPEFYYEAKADTTVQHAFVDAVNTHAIALTALDHGTSNVTGNLGVQSAQWSASSTGVAGATANLRGAHVPLASQANGVATTSGFMGSGVEKTETLQDQFANVSQWDTTGTFDLNSATGWLPPPARLQFITAGTQLISKSTYTLQSSYLHAQIFPESIGTTRSFRFGVQDATTHFIEFVVDSTGVTAHIVDTSGSRTSFIGPYNPTTMQWLRITESGGTILFEASKGGTSWITLTAMPTGTAVLSPVKPFIVASTSNASENFNPFVLTFDNVNLVPALPTPLHTLIDSFDTGISASRWTTQLATYDTTNHRVNLAAGGTLFTNSATPYDLINSAVVVEAITADAAGQVTLLLRSPDGPHPGGGHANVLSMTLGPVVNGKRTLSSGISFNGTGIIGPTIDFTVGTQPGPATNVTLGQAFGAFSMPLEQVQGETSANLDAQVAALADLGAGWQRGDYPIYQVSPTRGTFNYTASDQWIIRAVANNIKPVPILYMTPGWMNGGRGDKAPPVNNQDYADWCGTACQHLFSIGVRHVELWNEQNLGGFWDTGQAATDANTRQKYVAMAILAADKIHQLVPQMTVLSGGVSTADDMASIPNPPGHGCLATLYRYGELGLYQHVDAVAWHPYLDTDRPCAVVETWPMIGPAAFQALIGIIDQFAPGRNLKVWTTETGLPRTAVGGSTTQQAQIADNLWRTVLPNGCLAPQKDRIGPFFWFCVHDRGTDQSNRENAFGMKTQNFGTTYPVYNTTKSDFAIVYSSGSSGGGTTDPNFDIWLRIREIAGGVSFDYATDPSNFQTLWTQTAVLPQLRPVSVEITANAGTFAIDNVNGLPTYPAIGSIIDPFTSQVDPAVWKTDAGAVTWNTGRMRINGVNPAVSTPRSYSLAGSGIFIEFDLGDATGANVELRHTASAGAQAPYSVPIGFTIGGGRIQAYSSKDDLPDTSSALVNYNPVLHRWLRMRESGGFLITETSPDGVSWTQFSQWGSGPYAQILEPVSFHVAITGGSTTGGGTPPVVTTGAIAGGISAPQEHGAYATDSFIANQGSYLSDIGAGFFRSDYPIAGISPSQGTFNFASFDRWIIDARNRGVTPVPVIYITPPWMNGGSNNDKTPPASDSVFASWCATACAHLYDIGVRYVEIWNEQNHSTFWNAPVNDGSFAGKYTSMMAATYPAIKNARPGMNVILGGISTTDAVYGGASNGAYNTMVRYADLGTYAYCDAVAWHPYIEADDTCAVVGLYPMMGPAAVNAVLGQIDRVRPGQNIKLWTTETGTSRRYAIDNLGGGTGEDAQAGRFNGLFDSVQAGGCLEPYRPRLGPIFWFTMADRMTGDSREDTFGLRSADLSTPHNVYTFAAKPTFAEAWPVQPPPQPPVTTSVTSYVDNVDVAPASALPGGRSAGQSGVTTALLSTGSQEEFYFMVEYWSGGAWLSDPTCDIRTITLSRGRAKYVDPVAAGQLGVEMANFQGKWAGWNPDAWWATMTGKAHFVGVPTRLRMKPVNYDDNEVFVSEGNAVTLFTGRLDSVNDSWPGTTDAVTAIQATDGFKQLARHSNPGIVIPPGSLVGVNELTGARITRLANDAAWPGGSNANLPWLGTPRNIAAGTIHLQGTNMQGVTLNLMQQATECEWGWLFIDENGTLTFLDKDAVVDNPRMSTVQWTFVDDDNLLPGTPHICYEDIDLTIDDSTIINHVQITPPGGTLIERTDTASKDYFGDMTYTRTDLPFNDPVEAQATSDLILLEYAFDDQRIESLVFEATNHGPQHARAAANIKMNDRIVVYRRFPGTTDPNDPRGVSSYLLRLELLVMGIHHEIVAGGRDTYIQPSEFFGQGGRTPVLSWKVTLQTATALNVSVWAQWDKDKWDNPTALWAP